MERLDFNLAIQIPSEAASSLSQALLEEPVHDKRRSLLGQCGFGLNAIEPPENLDFYDPDLHFSMFVPVLDRRDVIH